MPASHAPNDGERSDCFRGDSGGFLSVGFWITDPKKLTFDRASRETAKRPNIGLSKYPRSSPKAAVRLECPSTAVVGCKTDLPPSSLGIGKPPDCFDSRPYFTIWLQTAIFGSDGL